MRILKFFFFVLVIGWGCQTIAPRSYGADYHGTVVDAETKQPLEGAVVVVVWYKKPLITMDGPQYFHKATEALTDAEGKFSVDASPGMNWNPFRRVLKDPRIYPAVVIFKPGYGPFPTAHLSSISKENEYNEAILKGDALMKAFREGILKGGAVVELPKLKTKEELIRFADMPSGVYSEIVPAQRISNLLRLINIQRKSLGLGPIGPVEQRRHP